MPPDFLILQTTNETISSTQTNMFLSSSLPLPPPSFHHRKKEKRRGRGEEDDFCTFFRDGAARDGLATSPVRPPNRTKQHKMRKHRGGGEGRGPRGGCHQLAPPIAPKGKNGREIERKVEWEREIKCRGTLFGFGKANVPKQRNGDARKGHHAKGISNLCMCSFARIDRWPRGENNRCSEPQGIARLLLGIFARSLFGSFSLHLSLYPLSTQWTNGPSTCRNLN